MAGIDTNYIYRRVNPCAGAVAPTTVYPITELLPDAAVRHPVPTAERGLCIVLPPDIARGTPNPAAQYNSLAVNSLEYDLPKAFRFLRAAIALNPGYDPAHNNLGLLLLETGDPAAAATCLKRAIATNETLDAAYSNKGLAYLEMDQPQKAAAQFTRALRINPGEPVHWNNYGTLWLDIGCPKTAAQIFNHAITLDQNNPMLYHNRGIAHRTAGHERLANQDFITASQLETSQYEAEFGSI